MKNSITDRVINRLTLYHCILADYEIRGTKVISSALIADLLNIDDSQVRKDLKLLNNIGRRRVGYEVKSLKTSIEEALDFGKIKNAFIVGAGNLGSALAKYDNFKNYGLNILALFDTDPLKIGIKVNELEIFHPNKLADLAVRLKVEIVILSVPNAYAQETTSVLINAGIKYIWNFTPCILRVPATIQVWNENLAGNFLQFTINHSTRLRSYET